MRAVRVIFAAAVLLLATGIKLAAALETVPLYHTLLFVPASFARLLTGENYAELANTYRFSVFILDYSYAGVNFLMLCIFAGAWHSMRRVQNVAQLLRALLLITFGAFAATNLANTFRIGLSLKLFPLVERHDWMHEAIGTIVFISFLIGYYQLFLRSLNAKTHSVG